MDNQLVGVAKSALTSAVDHRWRVGLELSRYELSHDAQMVPWPV
jgi:hypothetical protein